MTYKEITAEIAHWKEELSYHLGNYHRAVEVGSINSRDHSFFAAGSAASILTALLALQENSDG